MSSDFYELVSERYDIHPGMSAKEVERLMGKPNNIDIIQMNRIDYEQWCYHENSKKYYLYFYNGILCVFG